MSKQKTLKTYFKSTKKNESVEASSSTSSFYQAAAENSHLSDSDEEETKLLDKLDSSFCEPDRLKADVLKTKVAALEKSETELKSRNRKLLTKVRIIYFINYK